MFGVISGFLLPPPGWASAAGSTVPVRLGQFVITVLVGLIFLLVQKWNRKKHAVRWVTMTIIALVLSLSAFFLYQRLLDRRTCQYANLPVVIGTRYTQHAQSYVRENSTCSDLLEDFGGKAEDIWTQESIDNSRYVLALTYILTLPLFMICMISVIQAVHCQSIRRKSSTNASTPIVD